jgi:hypothetical protein
MMSFFEEHIDDYILGKLDDSTKTKFDQMLSDNAELSKKLDQHKTLVNAIKSYEFKQKLESVVKEKRSNDQQKTGRVINLRMLTAIAASILLIAFAVNQMFFTNGNNQMDQIFFTDPGLPTPMSETDAYDFYDAMVDYKAEKYQLALDKWSNLNNTVGTDTIQFYQAMAHYNLRNFETVSNILPQIKSTSSFYQKSQWYLIGALIELGDKEKAKVIFDQLEDTNYDQYESLKTILEK